MLLKSIIHRVRLNAFISDYERENLINMLYMILNNLEDNEIWKWKNRDHKTVIRHYSKIIRNINAKYPNTNINFELARQNLFELFPY